MAVDLLIVDDFSFDVLDQLERRDIAKNSWPRDIGWGLSSSFEPRPRRVAGNLRRPGAAQTSIDLFVNNAYDLIIDGASYRSWLTSEGLSRLIWLRRAESWGETSGHILARSDNQPPSSTVE